MVDQRPYTIFVLFPKHQLVEGDIPVYHFTYLVEFSYIVNLYSTLSAVCSPHKHQSWVSLSGQKFGRLWPLDDR